MKYIVLISPWSAVLELVPYLPRNAPLPATLRVCPPEPISRPRADRNAQSDIDAVDDDVDAALVGFARLGLPNGYGGRHHSEADPDEHWATETVSAVRAHAHMYSIIRYVLRK